MKQRQQLIRIALAGASIVGSTSVVACDREDRKDVEEGVEDADRQIDKLDDDGKDD